MKKSAKITAVSLFLSLGLWSCSSDEPEVQSLFTIGFESTGIVQAGPTSYGENCYANYDGTRFTSATLTLPDGGSMTFGINQIDGAYNFYNGGIVLSSWNIRSNPSDRDGDWWYSFANQCSVYNTLSTDGANTHAGCDGSDTFAVIFGYRDDASAAYKDYAQISFGAGENYVVAEMYVCNSAYAYGVMVNGNPFGIYGPGVGLEEAKGWFKVLAYGFDAQGKPTNGGEPVEKYICDYRDGASPRVELSTTWQRWDLSGLGAVNRVKFNFAGSDSGQWGLNTPAYICADNITVYKLND